MIEIKGNYSSAKVFADELEETAREQITLLCNQEFAKDSKIRIMPDVHAGAGCVIGFTADLGEMIIPNIVGVDIGCGMLTVEMGKTDIDFSVLDEIINNFIPSGQNVHEGRIAKYPDLQKLDCYRSLKASKRIERSIGTLGGGNHFIEIDVDGDDNKYLVIHTGSRSLGKQVAEIYQTMAYDVCRGADRLFEKEKLLIDEYKSQGRRKEIQAALKKMEKDFKTAETDIPKDLCYLTGEYREKYLHDMKICQSFAALNRRTIANIILDKLFGKGIPDFSYFETVHNYIDHKGNIIRKGAVSARENERLLIPINMRDGSLLCIGKGNEDWNFSAPHGAGRRYSRKTAKETFTVEEFEKSMEGIYSTSVCEATLDESPMAYKSTEDIVENIAPTAEVIKMIKPVYNFKAK